MKPFRMLRHYVIFCKVFTRQTFFMGNNSIVVDSSDNIYAEIDPEKAEKHWRRLSLWILKKGYIRKKRKKDILRGGPAWARARLRWWFPSEHVSGTPDHDHAHATSTMTSSANLMMNSMSVNPSTA